MSSVFELFWKMLFGFVAAFIRLIKKPSVKSIHGEIALVTGAGHGLGRLLCIRLAKLGATIVAVNKNKARNTETVEILKQMGATAYGFTADLSKASEIHRLASKVREEVGDVTMLINNAGIVYPTDILSLTEEMISNTFHVNVISHFLLIKKFLPGMIQNNHGHIFAMSSYVGLFGTAYMTDYSATKFAIVGLMESLRNELRRQNMDGIKLTCVCSSFVSTGLLQNPRTQTSSVPVLTPEYTVNESVDAILRDKFLVTLPSATGFRIFRDIVPDAVLDALTDYIRPEVDLIDTNTEDSNSQLQEC